MADTRCFTLKSEYDGLPLALCEVLPDGGAPKALVQLAHGMSEHKGRYLPFMRFLADHGYGCVINDHRGHGGSVKSPQDLGYFYTDGAKALVEDLRQVTRWARGQHPGLKLILFGHSMGSLALRVYRQIDDSAIDALVLCGSPGRNPFAGAALALNRLMTLFRGERYISPLFVQMITGNLGKRASGSSKSIDWLNDNPDNLRRYNADPLCGFPFTLNGYRALLTLLRDAYRPVPARNPELPVHFASGEEDPCAPNRAGFEAAARRLRNDGYRRVTCKMYPGMRHEVLNHVNSQEVFDDLLRLFDEWTR